MMRRLNAAPIGLAIFALAVVVRLAFWAQIHDTSLDRWHRWESTDMAGYMEQGRRLAVDDWWATEPYHPYHAWESIAPEEQWLAWYGPHTFHQAPAYAYMLALLRGDADAESERGLVWIKLLQLMVGGLTCVFLAGIARYLAGLPAAIATGLVAALYGPIYYLELQILREGLALAGIAAALLLVVRHCVVAARSQRVGRFSVLAIGLVAGGLSTLHEAGSLVAVLGLLAVTSAGRSVSRRVALQSATLLAIGWLVGFSPLLVRNVVVGAPPFSVSCRAPINFAIAAEAHAPEGGAIFRRPDEPVLHVLDAATDENGRIGMAAVVRAVAKSYDGNVVKMVGNAGRRFAKLWVPQELPDNTSFDFYRAHASMLGVSPTFGWIAAPGAAAMVLALVALLGGLRRKRSGPISAIVGANPGGFTVTLAFAAGIATALSFAPPAGRFRVYFALAFLVYLGVFVSMLVECVRTRRIRAASTLLAVALLFGILTIAAGDERIESAGRAKDYFAAAAIATQEKDYESALRFLGDDPRFARHRAEILVLEGLERQRAPTSEKPPEDSPPRSE
jgi:hypothetical protein